MKTLPERTDSSSVQSLIETCLARNIDAELIDFHGATRASWDGATRDIEWDLVILWKRTENCETRFGTHKGTIRNTGNPQADLFWGHYDFETIEEATKDYGERRI